MTTRQMLFRASENRGRTQIPWLDSYHSFSFGEYYDPQNRGFSQLRVINEDFIKPNTGFGTHPHQDMEIITYVLSGQLAHQDSMGNGSTIGPGEVQYMSAGTGVFHSEKNPSPNEPVHLFQIWIRPDESGEVPRYAQTAFPREKRLNQATLAVSKDGRDGSIAIRQNAELHLLALEADREVRFTPPGNRSLWIHLAEGQAQINGRRLMPGDAIGMPESEPLTIVGEDTLSELLIFTLPPVEDER